MVLVFRRCYSSACVRLLDSGIFVLFDVVWHTENSDKTSSPCASRQAGQAFFLSICRGRINSLSIHASLSALQECLQSHHLTVSLGSTTAYRVGNHQSEHYPLSAEISCSRRRSKLNIPIGLAPASVFACLAPASPPWITPTSARVFHVTRCFLPLNEIVGIWQRKRACRHETAGC